MCFSLMYCRRWGKIVYQATKEILPDNLTVVFRLKVRLAKKIVSTIRLDFFFDFFFFFSLIFVTKLREK